MIVEKLAAAASSVAATKTVPTTVSAAQAVVQTVTKKIVETLQHTTEAAVDKVSDADELKKTVVNDVQISPQLPGPGRIYKLDASQSFYDEDSHVFVYFIIAMLMCAVGYVVFHNKRKILALIIEGRQGHGDARRTGGVNYKRLSTEPPGVSVA